MLPYRIPIGEPAGTNDYLLYSEKYILTTQIVTFRLRLNLTFNSHFAHFRVRFSKSPLAIKLRE
jgi:hypothetical protein